MDLFVSLEKNLSNLDKSVHSKIENSIVDNFLHDLQNALTKMNSSKLLEKLPWHTILTFAKYENNYAVCFDYNEKDIYYVPKENIVGNQPEIGEALKIYSPRQILCRLHRNCCRGEQN